MKAKLDEIERVSSAALIPGADSQDLTTQLQTLAQFSPKLFEKPLQDDTIKPRSRAIPRASGSPLKQDSSVNGLLPDRSTSFKAKHHTVRIENAQGNFQGKAKLSEETVVAAPGWNAASQTQSGRSTFSIEEG